MHNKFVNRNIKKLRFLPSGYVQCSLDETMNHLTQATRYQARLKQSCGF